ncbi:hypothetical protein N665_6030s0001 [Sinapis alba]|nr:hypothetical protein N665_6030s0001 [Sinapis alba]
MDFVDVFVGFFRRRLYLFSSLSRWVSAKKPTISLPVGGRIEVTGDFSPSQWISSKETVIDLHIGGSRRGWKTVTSQSVAVFEEAKRLCLSREFIWKNSNILFCFMSLCRCMDGSRGMILA